MKNVRRTLLAIGILLSLPVAGQCGDSPTPGRKAGRGSAGKMPGGGGEPCDRPRGLHKPARRTGGSAAGVGAEAL